MKKHTRKLAVLAAIAVGVGGLGIAYAYFTSTGTGTGTAKTGTDTAWTVSVPNVTLGDLTPVPVIGAGPSDTVAYSITNASTGQQFLNQAVIHVQTGWSAPGSPTCTAADFSVGGELAGVAHTQAIANNRAAGSTYNNSVALQLVDNGANQDACRNVNVPITVDAS